MTNIAEECPIREMCEDLNRAAALLIPLYQALVRCSDEVVVCQGDNPKTCPMSPEWQEENLSIR